MKEAIGSGGVKIPISKFVDGGLKGFQELQDITPKELFQETVREFHKYILRRSMKVKTEVGPGATTGIGRLLSYDEIADVERKLLKAGANIKPKYYKGGLPMEKSIEIDARCHKLFEVIKEYIDANGHFRIKMLTPADGIRIRGNEKYLERLVYEDLKRLVSQGSIYRRGSSPTVYYLSTAISEEVEKAKKRSLGEELKEGLEIEGEVGFTVPREIHVTVDVNINFGSKG